MRNPTTINTLSTIQNIISGLIDDLRIQTSKRFKSDFDIEHNSNVFFGPRDKKDLCGDDIFQEELKL